RSLLEKAGDVAVIGEASDGQEAVELCAQTSLPLDVLLLDIGMPRMSGIQAAQAIRANHYLTRIIMLSMHNDSQLVRQAFKGGANGYVLKNALFDELLQAIHATIEGETYISPELAQALADPPFPGVEIETEEKAVAYERLSLREREILKL